MTSWKWWWGVGVTLMLLAGAAHATHNEAKWPFLLIDNTCTDLFDTLATGDAFDVNEPYQEVSGSPNGLCDHDRRIVGPGPITTDTVLGPFRLSDFGVGIRNIRISSFAIITPGGGTWNIDILYVSPIDTTQKLSLCQPIGAGNVGCTGSLAGTAAPVFAVGHGSEITSGMTDVMPNGFPDVFWIEIDLGTATSSNMFLFTVEGH